MTQPTDKELLAAIEAVMRGTAPLKEATDSQADSQVVSEMDSQDSEAVMEMDSQCCDSEVVSEMDSQDSEAVMEINSQADSQVTEEDSQADSEVVAEEDSQADSEAVMEMDSQDSEMVTENADLVATAAKIMMATQTEDETRSQKETDFVNMHLDNVEMFADDSQGVDPECEVDATKTDLSEAKLDVLMSNLRPGEIKLGILNQLNGHNVFIGLDSDGKKIQITGTAKAPKIKYL